MPMEIINSSYLFSLPAGFHPDFSKLNMKIDTQYPYKFAYSVIIKSDKKITVISKPTDSIEEIEEPNRNYATILCKKPDRELRVFYRTEDMVAPKLVFARFNGSGHL